MAIIVVADGDTTASFTMEATLEGEGHTVLTALDGYEALSLCESHRPDLVFLATNLPVMTGAEVCEALRNDPDIPADLPIILLHPDALDARVVERCGATGWMERAPEAHTLRERVVDLLGSRAGRE